MANFYTSAALESSSYLLGYNYVGNKKVLKGLVILTLILSEVFLQYICVGRKTI